jgi:hypothetical protein
VLKGAERPRKILSGESTRLDSMSNPFSIQPATLFRLTAIDPVAFQSLNSATTASAASLLASASSIVELSGLGQVLAAGSTLESSLEALGANTSNPTPGSVVATAQNFVATFNGVGQSISQVLPFLAVLPDNTLIARFAQTLNAAASTATGAGNENLSSLRAVGISFLAASPTDPVGSTARLSIDQAALNAAAQADPQGTAALLARATQALQRQVALFEVEATTASGLAGGLSVLGSSIPPNLLQSLSADTVLNNVQLTDLDLASVGLDANTIETASAVLATSLSATLAGPGGTTNSTTAPAAPATLIATPVAAALPATSDLATPGSATLVAGTPTAAATSQNPSATPATTNNDTLSVEQNNAAAQLALRNLLADSALRNVIFDPAYSALIASSHLIDFVSPVSLARANIPADIPGAILPVNPARAISSYEEAANGFVRRS